MSLSYNKSYISRFGSNHFFASRRELILKNSSNDGTYLYEETFLKEKKEVVFSRLFFKVIKLCLQTKSGSKNIARLLYKSCFKNSFLNNFFSCECEYKDFYNDNITHKNIKIIDFLKKKTLKLKKNKQFFGSSKEKSFFYKFFFNKQKKSNIKNFFLTNFYLKRIDILENDFCPFLCEYKVISNNFLFYLFRYEEDLLTNFISINNTNFTKKRKWFLQKMFFINPLRLKKKNYSFELDLKKSKVGNFYKGKEESFCCNFCEYKELKFICLFIIKRKETQDQTPTKVNLFNLNHNFPSLYLLLKKAKLFFLKSYFFSAHSLPFENRQIHRFIYFCLFSKRAENPFFTQTNLPFLISYNLDIFLFSFLYMWAKNQHENHSNSWVFNKYWVFLQPLAYFFYNKIGITSQNIYFKKKLYSTVIYKEFPFSTNYLRKENLFFYKTNSFSTFINIFYNKCKLNILLNRITKPSLNLKKVDDDFFNELNKNLKKKRILKTWYLENYKATFILKIDVNREQKKKFKFYFAKLKLFKNIKLDSFQTFCTRTFNQELEKDFYKKIFVSKDFKNLKYKHIKFYLTKRDFYLNKTFFFSSEATPNLYI